MPADFWKIINISEARRLIKSGEAEQLAVFASMCLRYDRCSKESMAQPYLMFRNEQKVNCTDLHNVARRLSALMYGLEAEIKNKSKNDAVSLSMYRAKCTNYAQCFRELILASCVPASYEESERMNIIKLLLE